MRIHNLFEFQERFPEVFASFMGEGRVNPLEIMSCRLFDADEPGDWREQAIDKCLENDLSFQSTHNTFFAIAARFLVVKCPRCGEPMENRGGASYPRTATIEFRCANAFSVCEPGPLGERPIIKLTLAHDGIDVRLPERAEREEGDETDEDK